MLKAINISAMTNQKKGVSDDCYDYCDICLDDGFPWCDLYFGD